MSHLLVTAILFDGTLTLEWEESDLAPNHDRGQLEKLLLDTYKIRTFTDPVPWLLVLGLSDASIPLSPALAYWREFSAYWLHLARTLPEIEEKRAAIHISINEVDAAVFLQKLPPMVGVDFVDPAFILNAWNQIEISYRSGIYEFKGTVEEYFASIAPKPLHIDRIHFHLVENRRDEQRPFAFLATYTSCSDENNRARHLPLKCALEEFGDHKEKLLAFMATVNRVAKKNSFVAGLVDSGELFHPVALSAQDAFLFLSGVADFEAAGILCRIPRWWQGGARKIGVTLSIGNTTPSRVGSDALLDFNAGLSCDGEPIGEADARRILERAEGLALVKGKWVAVDTESLRQTLDALKRARALTRSNEISFADAMRMLMGVKAPHSEGIAAGAEVNCGAWLKSVLEKMADPTLIRATTVSPKLKANLRHYQQQGFNWLCFMQSLGFGLCLADDMGLGKTVQILAFLQKLKQKNRTSLIVVPASLLQNWRTEIEKFTPDLAALIIHPHLMEKETFAHIEERIAEYDLAITTYGMLHRLPWLSKHTWYYLVCDEAQNIKNPTTKQTKAVKALTATARCVMTGTPVENRLTDLWSLFDFINPGLLGSFSEFKSFAKGLADNPDGYGKLRRVVRPYILRRSKTDKAIISDLPDKIEIKTWCALSKEQTVLYSQLVNRLDKELSTVEGIKRKGIILGYLTKFKQLCNHPDHYAGLGAYLDRESGKFQRLAELCETIYEKREKVLVFTQFAEIIPALNEFLNGIFNAAGLTLSGTTTVNKRKDIVERFQGGEYVPYLILSLKAGGVGLNLTAANHVIHFDRWWNPAVENQATDRAFRIGQKKNVMVHKFICKGTIEEKIDALIEDKRKLADEVIPATGEQWITEMDDRRIRELFRLTLTSPDND
jgi:superfamily II DNA or RNA helicase